MEIPEKARLGLPEMDEQHHYLYNIFNLVPEDNVVKDPKKMSSILDEIERYLNFHFTSEEHFMRMYDYPEFSSHQSDHELAASKLVGYMDQLNTENFKPASLRKFLFSWLYEHSISSDMKYVKWIEKVRGELTAAGRTAGG
ncbi:Methyl-accepting chemotaxis protein [Chitinispirillum alkaliphilum]|nr:Methyl-accepting chemotaxis protein [Chitinispirillum alkaliphilum]